jgi:hypothetical protein
MLNLTRQEQTVMIFILGALLVGAGIRHMRLNAMLPGRQLHSQVLSTDTIDSIS